MAHQIHVAYSDRIKSAGMMAGGPFGCAEGRPCQAVTACMRSSTPSTTRPMPSTETLLNKARELASADKIAPLSNLATSQVYIAHGAGDTVVGIQQTQGLHDFYVKAGVPENNIAMACDADQICSTSGHAVVTPNGPRECPDNEHPFLNKCGDQNVPDEILKQFYAAKLGRWNPPSQTLTGQLIAFNQPGGEASTYRLAETGYLYVPQICRQQRCPVHVAFHGCVQSEAVLAANDKELIRRRPEETHNNSFVRDAGYNASADANGIIILYPQVEPNFTSVVPHLYPSINYRIKQTPILPKDNEAPMKMFELMCTSAGKPVLPTEYSTYYGKFGQNPMGCWDWWGYTYSPLFRSSLYLTREAPQMKAVIEMLDKLGGGQAAPGYLEQWNDRSG